MSGFFITFEGGDGSGKSTQARLLAKRLEAAGHAVRSTREPGGTPLAAAVRALSLYPDRTLTILADAGLIASDLIIGDNPTEPILPLTEALLLSAARAQHVAHIREWLASDIIVISDRFADATIAYQGYGRGYDVHALRLLENLTIEGLFPGLTILLDIDPVEGLARKLSASSSGEEVNRLDRESLDFHRRVRAGYLELASQEPERWVVIDATQDIENIASIIFAVSLKKFSNHDMNG